MRSCLCNHQGSPTENQLFVSCGFVFFFLTRTKTHFLFPPCWCCSWIDIIKRMRTLRFLLHFFRVKPDKVWRWWCWAEWEYGWDGVTRQALFSSSLKGITLPSFLSFFLASHWILYFLLTYLTASLSFLNLNLFSLDQAVFLLPFNFYSTQHNFPYLTESLLPHFTSLCKSWARLALISTPLPLSQSSGQFCLYSIFKSETNPFCLDNFFHSPLLHRSPYLQATNDPLSVTID